MSVLGSAEVSIKKGTTVRQVAVIDLNGRIIAAATIRPVKPEAGDVKEDA